MPSSAIRTRRIAPSPAIASLVESLLVDECEGDLSRVLMPSAEAHLVLRLGPSPRAVLDLAAIGPRSRVQRKVVRGGHRVVMARLRLGATQAVLGARATELGGRIVMLDELWGDGATRRLSERIASARDAVEAAAAMDEAIATRLAKAHASGPRAPLVLRAAERLESDSVSAVATALGVSERNLRRVFHDEVGLSPKAFAKIARFRRALLASRTAPSWAHVASESGYYDQAHLIAEFRAIAGVKPNELRSELEAPASNRFPSP